MSYERLLIDDIAALLGKRFGVEIAHETVRGWLKLSQRDGRYARMGTPAPPPDGKVANAYYWYADKVPAWVQWYQARPGRSKGLGRASRTVRYPVRDMCEWLGIPYPMYKLSVSRLGKGAANPLVAAIAAAREAQTSGKPRQQVLAELKLDPRSLIKSIGWR